MTKRLKLTLPLIYNGKRLTEIAAYGPILMDAPSVFEEVRKDVTEGQNQLYSLYRGNPKVKIADDTVAYDLIKESNLYASRAAINAAKDTRHDTRWAVEDIDTFRAIWRMIGNQVSGKKDEAALEMKLAEVPLRISLAEYVARDRNYLWAWQLLNKGVEEICSHDFNRYPKDILPFPLAAYAIPSDWDFRRDAPTKYAQEIRSLMKARWQVIEDRMDEHQASKQEAVPDDTRHPESPEALMDYRSIVDIELMFMDASANQFIDFVGKEILARMVPAGVKTQLGHDSIEISESRAGSRRNLIIVKGEERWRKSFEIYDPSLYPKVLSLINSDPYVTMFGRLNHDIILRPKGEGYRSDRQNTDGHLQD